MQQRKYKSKRINYLIVILGVINLEAFAQNLPPCPKDGFRDNCTGTFIRKDGSSYVGPWLSDVPQDNGIFRKKDGVQYFPSSYIERRDFVDALPTKEIIPKATLVEVKKKCSDLGFKAGTEEFGKCVLKLSK